MDACEKTIQRLNKELNELFLEHQELHNVKIARDIEISAYRTLLQSEEQRLNISGQIPFLVGQSGAANTSGARGAKKRRLTGTLEFDESNISAVTSSSSSSFYTQSDTSEGLLSESGRNPVPEKKLSAPITSSLNSSNVSTTSDRT